LLAFPGATVVCLDGGTIKEVDYRDTDHYHLTVEFLQARNGSSVTCSPRQANHRVTDLDDRTHDLTRRWQVSVDEWIDTATSVIGFGQSKGQPAVLKVVKTQGDEWNAGAVAAAFGGQSVVRVLEHEPGAMLLERVAPGTSLVDIVGSGRDDEATDVLAATIAGMGGGEIPPNCATAEQWGRGFTNYRATRDTQIEPGLVDRAETTYVDLCATQTATRLLHGDLQHYNVIFDQSRGWVAIDPKGVVAEREFEVGPFLRNPHGMPELYSDSAIVAYRLTRLCSAAGLDYGRAIRWAFAEAVLSMIWAVEDNGFVRPDNPALLLARAVEPLCHSERRHEAPKSRNRRRPE
jgi:streptomycin 6-kinase